jgi:hypothetical protein
MCVVRRGSPTYGAALVAAFVRFIAGVVHLAVVPVGHLAIPLRPAREKDEPDGLKLVRDSWLCLRAGLAAARRFNRRASRR